MEKATVVVGLVVWPFPMMISQGTWASPAMHPQSMGGTIGVWSSVDEVVVKFGGLSDLIYFEYIYN